MPHSPEEKKKVLARVRRIRGQCDALERALEAGDAEHGASVHFVVPELDAGAVIAQAPVPVLTGDTAESLAQRVQLQVVGRQLLLVF